MNKQHIDSEHLHREGTLLTGQYDYLTGLKDMAGFFEGVPAIREEIRAKGATPAFLFLNFSGLKYYNRRNSFEEGDQLIREFGKLLRDSFDLERCCRYGQDHFGVLTEDTDLDARLERFAEQARELNGGKSLPVQIGVYLDTDEDIGYNQICDRTKIACDEIGDIYVTTVKYFDDSMVEDEKRQRHIIDNLDRAIEEGWIQVYYQPIIRAVNGRVCDEEALARWIDPIYGFLSPGDFIPVLEKANLIYKLDLHMLDLVLEKQTIQAEAGFQVVPSSINLSRSDFETCDIVEEFRSRVDAAGIKRSQITVEITESIVGGDFDFMKGQIERFRALGFPVWMDDFGSGYSSLDVLQQLQFDLIKFDMRFMQLLDKGGNGKIILTELVKMATALGVDMICEGVETAEQVEFLQEIGCSKLQGYYYEKPLSQKDVFQRYEKGMRIGFENPDEAGYYDAIGRVNLYDLSAVAVEDEGAFRGFFNTLPMAIIEVKDNDVRLVRSNQSYRDFMEQAFGPRSTSDIRDFTGNPFGIGSSFMKSIRQCCESGNRVFMDDRLSEGFTVHSFARCVAMNPVTKTYAVALAVLSVVDISNQTTYENIAKALAQDYFNIFYINMDTEEFIEYTASGDEQELVTERRGEEFFRLAARDARTLLYEEDQDRFIKSFTKGNVEDTLTRYGTYAISYRLKTEGDPFYVLMKATRMKQAGNFVIIGVSNVDAQMKQRDEIQRIRQEKVALSRIMALAGDYLALYTVSLDSGTYVEYSSNEDYQSLGLMQEGDAFFEKTWAKGLSVIYKDDLARFLENFTQEKMLRGIEKYGVYEFQYRLMLNKEPVPICARAALVEESDGKKLIIGLQKLQDRTSADE